MRMRPNNPIKTKEIDLDMQTQTNVKRLVSIREARHLLGDIGHTTIYELIKRREITKVNIGRRGFITSGSLDAYIDRLSQEGSTPST
jgi:predicted DNA-binding transcriptional regulator AlpA